MPRAPVRWVRRGAREQALEQFGAGDEHTRPAYPLPIPAIERHGLHSLRNTDDQEPRSSDVHLTNLCAELTFCEFVEAPSKPIGVRVRLDEPPCPVVDTDDEGTALTDAIPTLGDTAFDVYLNERAYWRNVPAAVWNYQLGGYQVLKKWLSYRESKVLGRLLLPEEIQHFTDTARRIAAISSLVANT